jgi:predicted NAD/FAD-binding protein
MPRSSVKVAVIGSGLAGLTAAHLLSTTEADSDDVAFEVHLFEKVWCMFYQSFENFLR